MSGAGAMLNIGIAAAVILFVLMGIPTLFAAGSIFGWGGPWFWMFIMAFIVLFITKGKF